MTGFDEISAAISNAIGEAWEATRILPAAGGCINSAVILAGADRRYFVKLNTAPHADMFAAEAEGLAELARAGAVRVPTPVCCGTTGDRSYIALEFLELASVNDAGVEQLGQQLAHLHRHAQPTYGWRRDNTIGTTPQCNAATADWVEFWRRERLEYQLDLAVAQGYAAELEEPGRLLAERLKIFFADYRPAASLLHGDLWSGNYGVTTRGEPVIFDPAVYYGDREADLAMTELFGGFPPRFYQAYRAEWPLDPGYAVRKTLYNLYHVLNHLNLFGGGYLKQAQYMLDRLLRETR